MLRIEAQRAPTAFASLWQGCTHAETSQNVPASSFCDVSAAAGGLPSEATKQSNCADSYTALSGRTLPNFSTTCQVTRSVRTYRSDAL